MKNCLPHLGFALASLAALAGTAMAQSDRNNSTTTGWYWLAGATSSDINAQISAGYRPFDIQRNSSTSFDTVMVANSGVYQKTGSTTYYGTTISALSTALSNANQRLIALSPYDTGSGTNVSGIAISNTGADAAGWGWLVNQTPSQITNWVNNNPTPLRLIDLNTYTISGTRYYSAVAVNNTGAQAQGWWYYFDQTAAQIDSLLNTNHAQLVDLIVSQNPTASQPARFTCIMAPNTTAWWWYYNATIADLNDQLDLNAARMVQFDRYTDAGGATKFAGVMIDNANALTDTVRNVITSGLSDGVAGGYMKEVGGSELCAIGANHVFEPASMMKILYGAYAIDRCAAGLDSLSTNVFVPDRCNPNECPDAVQCNPGNEPLSTTIRGMLENSDNNRTKVVHDRYGRTNLNNYAHSLGMTSTNINHDIGCGLPANELTLRDAGLLYEKIADNTLFSQTWQDTLYDLMIDNTGTSGTLSTEITNGAALTSLTATEISQFRTLCYMAQKGGSYGINGKFDLTNGGWMRLPFKSGGNIVYHEYVITSFTNQVTSQTEAGNTDSSIWWTMARDRIRAALASWDSACTPPAINNQPDPVVTLQGTTADFIVGNSGTTTGQTFLWKRSGSTLANGAGPGGSIISGATTNHLHIANVQPGNTGNYQAIVTNGCGSATSTAAALTVTQCGTADFNGDGDVGTDQDIEAFFRCLAGNCCVQCGSADFNGDGDTGTDQDIEAFFRVLAGGHC